MCYAGYVCEAYNNPPDFFLDVVNGDTAPVQHDEGTVYATMPVFNM